jgi:hypothetical protein
MVFFVVDEVALLNAVLCAFTAITIYFDIKLCDIHTYTPEGWPVPAPVVAPIMLL